MSCTVRVHKVVSVSAIALNVYYDLAAVISDAFLNVSYHIIINTDF